MTETNRVQRWREDKRQHGLKAVTIWLTTEEELRLKDLALQWHCSPSAVMQHALAQFSPQTTPGIRSATDLSQIRELIRAEFLAMQGEKVAVTDTVTEVVTDTLSRDLPGLVRQLVEGLALEALGLSVTDTFGGVTDTDDESTDTHGNVTDTEALDLPVTDTDYGNVSDITIADEEVATPAPRQTRRPRGEMRQRILTLLGEHPEGLSAEEIRVYIQAEKPLGDTLQGMRRQGKVHTRGQGKDMRYFVE
jgi:hypothetical protein